MSLASKPPLGRLERVDLREYWLSEAAEFTPWLALAREENIALLGEAIGLDLEVESSSRTRLTICYTLDLAGDRRHW